MTTDANGVVLGPIPTGVPHLAIPFEIGKDGTALTLEQNSVAEVVQSVANLVGTTPGTRLMQPAYGIPDPTFEGINKAVLATAVRKYEPRAQVSLQVTPGNEEFITVGVAGGTG